MCWLQAAGGEDDGERRDETILSLFLEVRADWMLRPCSSASRRLTRGLCSCRVQKSAGDEKKGDLLRPENLRELRDVIMNFQIAGRGLATPPPNACETCETNDVCVVHAPMSTGRDTVAQALAWSVYLLSLHPDVQEKVHDEAVAVLGNTPVEEVGPASGYGMSEYAAERGADVVDLVSFPLCAR